MHARGACFSVSAAHSVPEALQRPYLTFGDIDGKLDVLNVECTRCPRRGRYNVAKLIERYWRKGNMTKGTSDPKGDCPKPDAHDLRDRCDLMCPDLPKVL